MVFLNLQGEWALAADPYPCKYDNPPEVFPQTMTLPGTTAQQRIGMRNPAREDGCLTELYPFSGQIWLRKTVRIPDHAFRMPHCTLTLERTRITRLWINGRCIGSENSLCTPHIYDISGLLTPETTFIICVKNTDYPVPGGHMTSPDTQTNWIGITGDIRLDFHASVYLSGLQAYPDAAARQVMVKGILHGAEAVRAKLSAKISTKSSDQILNVPPEVTLNADADGRFSVTIPLPDDAPLWTEYAPERITFFFGLPEEHAAVVFGLRNFKACGDHFELNGVPVMLRGKHDGMVFPLSGAAPTELLTWMQVLGTVKEWGFNHIRFHTCCPPEAAFAAADALGIFMEPELPFWGTVDAPDGEKYDKTAQDYLIREGLRICNAFGNHPSFCMFSLGNELWGSKERLGEIIDTLRNADPRPLYTQGSNNFQHFPVQIPQEDFWTGVRTGKARLLRGSFADCDSPLGRLQTHAPSTDWDYELYLVPESPDMEITTESGETEIEIQLGIGIRRVKAITQDTLFYPTVPVVTHEIGQYNCFPDFDEIPHYTGVLAARNLEIFRERLEKAGMDSHALEFYECSGAFARECYKNEIEAAMRSPHLAGFQLLDLQDFPGQGTALVGMLNALLENKGFIQPEEWRGFCGDLVPLARFHSYVQAAGSTFSFAAALRISRPHIAQQILHISLDFGGRIQKAEISVPESGAGLITLGRRSFDLPADAAGKAVLTFSLPQEKIKNTWNLTVLPPASPAPEVITVRSYSEAEPYLEHGERVLLLPNEITDKIEGFYCTDFWNYHMFRIISESMGKKVPVGTMGLCIDKEHPIAAEMFSERYSTPQWYSAVMHSECAVLDDAPAGYRPIVQVIDNVERNHRLGMIFETAAGNGKLLICTVRFWKAPEDLSLNRLRHAVVNYIQSDAFAPKPLLSTDMLRRLFR
ncbi:MAG: beta-glucuronidase [Oscillospiraceae bacterium]|nr:beta-glucuronidase [Oscillospiraceae bacterium]